MEDILLDNLQLVDRPSILKGLLSMLFGRKAQVSIGERFLAQGYIWRGVFYAYRTDYGHLGDLLKKTRETDAVSTAVDLTSSQGVLE